MENHDCIHAGPDVHGLNADPEGMRLHAMQDIETLLLSPDARYRWRCHRGDDYDAYPFRKVSVFNFVCSLPGDVGTGLTV